MDFCCFQGVQKETSGMKWAKHRGSFYLFDKNLLETTTKTLELPPRATHPTLYPVASIIGKLLQSQQLTL